MLDEQVQGVPGTAQRILEAATELFVEKNYEGTSMREIASAVGVTPASLYNHYVSKEDILWEIVQQSWTGLHRMHEAADVPDSGTVARFTGFIDAHSRFHVLNPQIAGITNRQLRSLSAERYHSVMELRRDYAGRLRALLAAGVREGLFRVDHLSVTTFALLDMGMGPTRWFDRSKELSVDDLCAVHVTLALRLVGHAVDGPELMTTSPTGFRRRRRGR